MIKKIAINVVFVVILLGIWIYAEKKNAKAVQPPKGASSIVAFLEIRPQFSGIRKFVHKRKVYVVVFGENDLSLFGLLSSGPPAYIFDETGVLVDWTKDFGDASSFVDKWGGLNNATTISVGEARKVGKK